MCPAYSFPMIKYAIFLLWPLTISAGYFDDLSPQPIKCDYNPKLVSYSCKHVTRVFPDIYYGNYHLQCVDCTIPIFEKATFPHPNTLISMNLTASGLKNITSHSFESLPTLQFIYLQYNNIWNISEDAFYSLRQVYELHLEHNRLTDLTPRFLNGFEANTIIMAHNKLVEIPDNIFEGIFGVMTLDLSYNKLSTLHLNSFRYLDGLEYLTLEGNQLCNIPLGAFRHLKHLRDLNLSHNRFKKFNHGMFSGLPNLLGLNLSYNALIDLDAATLLPLTGIAVLDVSGNGLHYFDSSQLQLNIPSLRRIGLSDNLWLCTSLINTIQHLRSLHIEIIEHSRYEVTNVMGIACSEKFLSDEKIPFKTFYKIVTEFTSNYYNYC